MLRVTLPVWLLPEESTQVKEMLWPGWAPASADSRVAAELTVAPLALVMTSPATSPADCAAVWGTTLMISAPELTGGVDWLNPPKPPPPALLASRTSTPRKAGRPMWTVALPCPCWISVAIDRAVSMGIANPTGEGVWSVLEEGDVAVLLMSCAGQWAH